MKYPSSTISYSASHSLFPSPNFENIERRNPSPIEARRTHAPNEGSSACAGPGSPATPGRSGLSTSLHSFRLRSRRPLSSKMARKGRFTKKSKVGQGCQQPQMAPSPASATHRDDSEILPDSGDSVPPTSRPFLPPRNVPRPAPQTSTTTIQNSEPSRVNSTDNANDVDSVDQEADDSFVDSRAQNHKGRKTTEFWKVRIISNLAIKFYVFNPIYTLGDYSYSPMLSTTDTHMVFTIKPARLSIREAMERPNGRKIVLRFNKAKQAIGNEAGLLSGVLGLLGSDFGKFSICEESWRKITTKDKVYNECVKHIFHIDEDSEGTIKKIF
ncbi:hypothetical protein Ahy_B08g091303 [Arachis hypogaea]|uniref:Uncharacterized protein n=1 Tax=Arachis hypogaea TaxID=3818 RepID=A0A444Y200_ARAHY|nr:hypothetical protein Ahy_B08g091303 [Arachis hypogaea]